MSGLGGFSTGNKTFLSIGIGKDEKGNDRAVVGRSAKKGDHGAVQVFKADGEPAKSTKTGEDVYRTEYAFVEGLIKLIHREKGFDEKPESALHIDIATVDGETFTLNLPKGGDYWTEFALRCDGIDFSKPVKLAPYSIPQEDNPKYSNRFLVPYQGGVKVEKKWKIEWMREVPDCFAADPGAPPPFTYDGDEDEWKKHKTFKWLDANPIQRAIDKVNFLNEQPAVEKEPAPAPVSAPEVPNEMDDLPW